MHKYLYYWRQGFLCLCISCSQEVIFYKINSQLTEYQAISISPSKKKKSVSIFVTGWGQNYSYHSGWKNNFMKSLGNPVRELKCNLNSSENKKVLLQEICTWDLIKKKRKKCALSPSSFQWGAAVNTLLALFHSYLATC